MKDDKPVVFIECKAWHESLTDKHIGQLTGYFNTRPDVKFAVLTNGNRYMFFADLDEANMMDASPYLDFYIERITKTVALELDKFRKTVFDEENIRNNASALKYHTAALNMLKNEFEETSYEFVKHFGSHVYHGRYTKPRHAIFTPILKKALNTFKREIVDREIQEFQDRNDKIQEEEIKKEEELKAESENKIVTTEEELEGYHILKSIVRQHCDHTQFLWKDNQTYFATYYAKQTQPLCRLYFNNESRKYFVILDADRNEKKYDIESVDDIYRYVDDILAALNTYLQ